MSTGTSAILTEVFLGFHSPFTHKTGLGRDRFLPNPLQFISHPTFRHYVVLLLTVYLWLYNHCGSWPFFQFLKIYTVGLLGRGISPSQGHYLHTEQHKHRINAHRHPCLGWNSNPRSQCSSGRRRLVPGPRVQCDRLNADSVGKINSRSTKRVLNGPYKLRRFTLVNIHQFSLPLTSEHFISTFFSVYVVVVVAAWRHGLESALIRYRSNSKTKNPLDAWWDSMNRRKGASQGRVEHKITPFRLVTTRITTLPSHLRHFFRIRLALKPL
jgi:hypothetical protein